MKDYELNDEDINILILSLYNLYITDGIKEETKLKIKALIKYLR